MAKINNSVAVSFKVAGKTGSSDFQIISLASSARIVSGRRAHGVAQRTRVVFLDLFPLNKCVIF
jgi:hypothetical protein